ncbi:hypothetical protein AMECASPLE_038228 [Ameca splendens]|uniref:Uncharacterized protein n=1 Tax=Ameca splendens TaxID=208324 RepID=A0ABV0YWH8_9TELE
MNCGEERCPRRRSFEETSTVFKRQGKPLHSACRDSVSTGDFSGTVCFCRPQRETSLAAESWVEEIGPWERVLSPPPPQLLEVG